MSELPARTYTATEVANLYAAKTGMPLHPCDICDEADRLGIPRGSVSGQSQFPTEAAQQLLAVLMSGPTPGER